MVRRDPSSLRQKNLQQDLERKRRRALMTKSKGKNMTAEDRRKWPKAGDRIIVKIQVPVMSTDLNAGCLIYDQGRAIEGQIPSSSALLGLMRGDLKAFFSCILVPDPNKPHGYKIDIRTRVLDRNW